MKKLVLTCAALGTFCLSAAVPALADKAAADQCAAGLDANGKAIYAAAAPKAAAASDLRALVTDTTKGLVMQGALARDAARGAAEAAGACLAKLR